MPENILKVDNIHFSIGELKILEGLSCSINAGETVGIIGPNGSGKTTFFNCLSGFSFCQTGSIVFKGADITMQQPFKRAMHGMGRVFQNFGIFRDMSVCENVVLAIEGRQNSWSTFFPWAKQNRVNRKKALEYLAMVKLQDKADQKAGSLSGGQMRLLEIVRTLAFEADLFLLDEPTSGVSPKMKDEVTVLIKHLKQMKKTVMIIEHDVNFIQQFCDRILVLDEGNVIIDDLPDNVRKNPLLQEVYFGSTSSSPTNSAH